MGSWRAAASAVAAVGLVALTGAPAGATVVDPAPSSFGTAARVTVPSSVIGSLDEATAAQRARAVHGVTTTARAANIWRMPVTLGNLTRTAAVGGATANPLAVGAGGFLLGFEGTNAIMRLAGVEDVGFAAVWDYYHPQADPGFIPNADLGPVAPGWVGGVDTFASAWGSGWDWEEYGPVTVRVQIVTAPEYGVAGPVVMRLIPLSEAPAGVDYVFHHGTFGSGKIRISDGFAERAVTYPEGSTGPTYWPLTFAKNAEGSAAMWYPVGHPDRPADVSEDPLRVWETRWQCQGGDVQTRQSAEFRETDATWPPFPAAECPSGEIVLVEVWEVPVEAGAEEWLVERWTPKQPYLDWQVAFPECGKGACTLELYRVDPTTGARTSCFATPELCVDWWQDPSKVQNFACVYGGHAVDLDECKVYATTFNVATGTPVKMPDGSNRRADETGAYADPATGDPVPAEGTNPGPGGATAPEGCPPPFEFTLGGLGYWVARGALCALQMAFVPRGDVVVGELTATREMIESKPPFTLLAPVVGVFEGFADGWGTGCEGNVADFDPWQEGRLAFPCTPPQSPPFLVLYGIAVVALVVSTGFYVWSLIVSALNGRGGGGES